MAAVKAQKAGDTKATKEFTRLAYETWYRSRSRDALDFYALRNTRIYEDKYGYTEPKDIVKQVKDSRRGGVPNAAPAAPPSVGNYY